MLETSARVVWVTPQVGMGMRFEARSPRVEDEIAQILKIVKDEHPPKSESPSGRHLRF